MNKVKKIAFYAALVVLWVGGSVFMGGIFLSVKQSFGFNIFTTTGYHAFESCLMTEAKKAIGEKSKDP